MNSWEILSQVRQRVAEEEGMLRKTALLKVALCHPTPYSVGMSSLGFQTIYREIHQHPDASAERAFLPDNPEEYRRNHQPVFTYEEEQPLSQFPAVAFSIAYELEITGIFEMLDLSGIPLLRQERTNNHPLIIAGGPQTVSNPAILFPFVDLIILGEGEDRIHQFLDAVAEMKREDMLEYLSRLPGFYVPGISTIDIRVAGQSVIVEDSRLPAYSQILTPNTVLSSMFLIEPERGCSRSCNYCVMRCANSGGMRLVAPDKILSLIPDHVRRIGLVGAAVTDHPQMTEIVRQIVTGGREIGISSLRADRLNEEFVRLLAQGGYRTLTTASDGVSQRMRDLVDRKIEERHLIRAAELVRMTGMQRLKLYQMVGFPGETMEDIEELIRFSLELSSIAPLSLSIAPFAAKRNTPLADAPFEPIASVSNKLSMIRAGLKGKVEVKPSSARWAWIEYMLSQGNELAGLAAMDAWRNGNGFAAWKQAFKCRGIKTKS
jgi:radical SAM superfamily enzyme YgiQ (UPF0313 family)